MGRIVKNTSKSGQIEYPVTLDKAVVCDVHDSKVSLEKVIGHQSEVNDALMGNAPTLSLSKNYQGKFNNIYSARDFIPNIDVLGSIFNVESDVSVDTDIANRIWLNDALFNLYSNGEAYYSIGGRWYSQNIRSYIQWDTYPTINVPKDSIITIRRVSVKAAEYFARYIDFSSISISNAEFKAYKITRGYALKSDAEFIRDMLLGGEIYSAMSDPNKGGSALLLCQSKNALIDTYEFAVIPKAQEDTNFHTGEFYSNACTEKGTYLFMTSGRPVGSVNGENYILYVDKDGAQSCQSIKNPDNWYKRATPNGTWEKVDLGGFPTRDVASIGNPDDMLQSGVYAYEWISGFSGIEDGRYDVFVERSTTADPSGYYAIKQTFSNRERPIGYIRVLFRNPSTGGASNNPIIPLGIV